MQEQHQKGHTHHVAAVAKDHQGDGDKVVRHLILEILREIVGHSWTVDGRWEGAARSDSFDGHGQQREGEVA